jgi:hypothetical protein
MPAVIVLRDELFSIFRRGTKYLHGVAHAYDEFSSNLTEAIEARINGDMDEYNFIVYTVCPKIINGVDGDDQAKDRISESIDRALTDGLARFDIE